MTLKLADVVKHGPTRKPQRWMLHAGPGWGKTSFAAYAPRPIFVQAKNENGVETLQDFGMIPPTAHIPEAQSWEEFIGYLRMVRRDPHDHRTLVLDTINGAADLLQQNVLKRDFGNSLFEFASYGRGWEATQALWIGELLPLLTDIQVNRNMSVLLLCHTKQKTYNNPTGPNYDRYWPDMNERLFHATFRWCDGVLFGMTSAQLVGRAAQKNQVDQKAKVEAVVGERRIYTEETAAWVAKHRHGLPPIILGGKSAKDTWEAFASQLAAARRRAEVSAAPDGAEQTPPSNPEPESVTTEAA